MFRYWYLPWLFPTYWLVSPTHNRWLCSCGIDKILHRGFLLRQEHLSHEIWSAALRTYLMWDISDWRLRCIYWRNLLWGNRRLVAKSWDLSRWLRHRQGVRWGVLDWSQLLGYLLGRVGFLPNEDGRWQSWNWDRLHCWNANLWQTPSRRRSLRVMIKLWIKKMLAWGLMRPRIYYNQFNSIKIYA